MENNERVIEKIKKVLELAKNNPSEEEAKAAALQAQKLLAKYHIEMSEVEGIDLDKIESIDEVRVDVPAKKWKYELARIISKNFRCKHFYYGKGTVVFYGHKTDAEIAAETFKYLFSLGNKLANREVKRVKWEESTYYEWGNTKGVYNSFVSGFMRGIRDALDAQCTALALVVPEDVSESYAEMTAGFKSMKTHSVSVGNWGSYSNGRTEGRNAMQARAWEG
jgi:hypothetical protein